MGLIWRLAMVVRFITRRFIGDYDSSTDKVYNYSTFIDNEMITFEIIDTPGVRNVSSLIDNFEVGLKLYVQNKTSLFSGKESSDFVYNWRIFYSGFNVFKSFPPKIMELDDDVHERSPFFIFP